MNQPTFTIQDIKYSVNSSMFERAQKLYESGKVQKISETPHGYEATVQGSSPYHVSLSRKHIDHGYCDCYMGQNDELCKHMLALGLAVLHLSGKTKETKEESRFPFQTRETLIKAFQMIDNSLIIDKNMAYPSPDGNYSKTKDPNQLPKK